MERSKLRSGTYVSGIVWDVVASSSNLKDNNLESATCEC